MGELLIISCSSGPSMAKPYVAGWQDSFTGLFRRALSPTLEGTVTPQRMPLSICNGDQAAVRAIRKEGGATVVLVTKELMNHIAPRQQGKVEQPQKGCFNNARIMNSLDKLLYKASLCCSCNFLVGFRRYLRKLPHFASLVSSCSV